MCSFQIGTRKEDHEMPDHEHPIHSVEEPAQEHRVNDKVDLTPVLPRISSRTVRAQSELPMTD